MKQLGAFLLPVQDASPMQFYLQICVGLVICIQGGWDKIMSSGKHGETTQAELSLENFIDTHCQFCSCVSLISTSFAYILASLQFLSVWNVSFEPLPFWVFT